MKLSEFYKQAIHFGASRDPRRKTSARVFSDSSLLNGDPDTQVHTILVGIDIEVPELLLADRLRESRGLDLVLSHHPEGKAFSELYKVMRLQSDLLSKAGMPLKVAEEYLEERIREVSRRLMANNHMRAIDAAKLLELPFMCLHTPADNHVAFFLRELFAQKKPRTAADIVKILMDIPEYRDADKEVANGPKIILGSPRRPAGKIFLEMTGGTEGPKDIYDKLYRSGIRTLVSMHLSEEHFKKAKDANLNVVIAGHISSDTLGLNLLLDRIEKKAKEEFSVISCSGFRRIRRQ
ncbi:MAG: NGG1p interacting factor NIF3 [Candidatus Omnitrophica bacterium]|nr:NGG1p interacting factor NIF3 [Candidatus Omnitrophota bacterium]